MNIVTKNPIEVQLHWTRQLLPKPSRERVNAISDTLARGAKLPPGYLVEPNLLVAGETRRLAHKARQTDMEFIVITEEEAMTVALQENTNRQSYKFKYQVAFAYCPLAAKVAAESAERKAQNVTNPARQSNIGLSGKRTLFRTLDELADAIQVSRALMLDAKKTYDLLSDWDKAHEPKKWGDLKHTKMTALQYWTERIMDPEDSCTPGQARAGLAGSEAAAEGKTNPQPNQLELFLDGFKSVGKWGKCFTTLSDDQRRAAVTTIKKTIAQLPPELRAEIAAEIKLQEAK